MTYIYFTASCPQSLKEAVFKFLVDVKLFTVAFSLKLALFSSTMYLIFDVNDENKLLLLSMQTFHFPY